MLQPDLDSLVPTRDFNRRDFVRTAVGSGFAAAVLPIGAQTIRTDSAGLTVGEVTIPSGDFKMPAYRAMPATGANFPVVLVVQEIFGVHEHIKDVCRRVAKAGYFAIAPELYARQGDPSKYTDIGKLVSDIVAKVEDAQVMSDLDACVAFARDSGKAETTRLGITGFCWGGRVVFMYAAHNPKVKAAVAWYGQTAQAFHVGEKTPIEVAPNIQAAVLGLYGGADEGIPTATVEKMFAELKASGNARSEYKIYPGTPHGFNADYRPTYRKAEAQDAWNRMIAWFKLNL